MQTLSKEQSAIVDDWVAHQGAMLVSASAGSGKTRILTECVRRLIEDSPKDRSRILCLTFTNKVADEMLERLKKVKGVKERSFIGTIHAFGLEILKSYRHELNYSEMPHIIERETDRKEILKDVFIQNAILQPHILNVPEDFKTHLAGEQRLQEHQINLLTNTLAWIGKQKQKLIYVDEETTEIEGLDEKYFTVFKQYNIQLRNQQLIEFDDILLFAWKLLEKPSIASIYQRLYKYMLIDEAQDLNFAQYQFIKALCGDKLTNILMVGDSNQAIHGYAGASKKYMFEEFVKDYSARQSRIEKNYRSSKAVLQTANLLIDQEIEHAENQHFEGKVEIRSFETESKEANWIVGKIQSLLQITSEEFDGRVTLEKIAVLARNKFVFKELQRQFDEDDFLQNKYHVRKGNDAIDPVSTIMKIFDRGTRIIANHQGIVYWNQLKEILQVNNIELSDSGFDSLISLKEKIASSSQAIDISSYEILLGAWRKIDKDISNLQDALQYINNALSNFSDENERANVMSDINEWTEAWNAYLRNSSNRSLADFRRFTALGFNKPNQEKGLTLATVHAVKGLEFDIVFLMGMNQGTFPDYRALRANGKAMEEEKNNVYVAVTRAKRHIYISFPRVKMMPWNDMKAQKKSTFLTGFSIIET